jgi:hypothetical protein
MSRMMTSSPSLAKSEGKGNNPQGSGPFEKGRGNRQKNPGCRGASFDGGKKRLA